MRSWRRTAVLLAGGVLALSAPACAAAGPGAGGTPPAPAPSGVATPAIPGTLGAPGTPGTATGRPAAPDDVLVEVNRSGGLAGVAHNLVVRESGRWIFEAPTGGASPASGTLSAADRRGLRALLADPALAAEAERPLRAPKCTDGFTNSVTNGATITVSWQSCGGTPKVAGAIFRLVSAATPL